MCVFPALLMVICFEFGEKGYFPEKQGGKRPNECHPLQAEGCSGVHDLHQDAVASVSGMCCVLLPQKLGRRSW